jgi:hypothetical protein
MTINDRQVKRKNEKEKWLDSVNYNADSMIYKIQRLFKHHNVKMRDRKLEMRQSERNYVFIDA